MPEEALTYFRTRPRRDSRPGRLPAYPALEKRIDGELVQR